MGIFDFFSKKPATKVVRDRWNGWAYTFGQGERCVVSFDVEACEASERRASTCVRVIGFAPESEVGRNGMPSQRAYQELTALEDALVAKLGEDGAPCWLVGRQTYRGMRELIFQVEDVAAFERVHAIVAPRFLRSELVKKDGWTFFDEKIAPGERGMDHIGNRNVLEGLRQAGANLSLPHVVEPHFVGPPVALERLAAELARSGFRVQSRTGDSTTFAIEIPLDVQDEIDEMTMFLRGKAREHGVTYDGWGAAVRRGTSSTPS